MSRVLCITGTGRSGTSLTASWLQACGVVIDRGRLLGPSKGNERGHFEDRDFLDLHARATLRHAPGSDGWKLFDTRPLSFDPEESKIAQALIADRRTLPLWGWKDPRTTLFLAQWKRLIPGLKFVFVWRNYADVAGSLVERGKRNSPHVRISSRRAVQLWIAYNQRLLAFKREFPRDCILISLPGLISDADRVWGLMRERFGFDLASRPLRDFYEGSLMHRHRRLLVKAWGKWRNASAVESALRRESDIDAAE